MHHPIDAAPGWVWFALAVAFVAILTRLLRDGTCRFVRRATAGLQDRRAHGLAPATRSSGGLAFTRSGPAGIPGRSPSYESGGIFALHRRNDGQRTYFPPAGINRNSGADPGSSQSVRTGSPVSPDSGQVVLR